MLDQVEVEVRAGAGGAGCVSFHREKFVPLGGPDGGNGGRGGHVSALATAQTNTLNRYRHTRRIDAKAGQPGESNNRHGRAGEDTILDVPAGTVVIRLSAQDEPDEVIADLRTDGQVALLARGGRGGRGNTYFKNSINQAPRVAQRGHRGETARLRLELRLIADVGVVGLPNAGKSTLLRALSAARPRVGEYPFTTLEPALGVVAVGWGEFVLADLPGLIEGAAEGVGLGHDFLRHTARTRLLLHLIDGSVTDPVGAYDTICHELEAYSAELARRPQLVVINKIDQDDVGARRADIEAAFRARDIQPLFVSAAAGIGARELAERCARDLQEVREAIPAVPRELPIIKPKADSRRFHVHQESDGVYRVAGAQIETFVEMMDMENELSREEAYRWLARRGVVAALRRGGVQAGDRVRVGDIEWEWEQ